jgi:hypothetical protein
MTGKTLKFKPSFRYLPIASNTAGRDGEREVAEYLDNLTRRGNYVFHDIPANGFNIDHIVVSTHGIFTLETKAYSKPEHGDAYFGVKKPGFRSKPAGLSE